MSSEKSGLPGQEQKQKESFWDDRLSSFLDGDGSRRKAVSQREVQVQIVEAKSKLLYIELLYMVIDGTMEVVENVSDEGRGGR